MHSAHLLTTANLSTYFFIMLHAVMVNPQVQQKSSLLFHKSVTLSSLSVYPLSPTDICTVWQSIISPHLQKASLHRCMGGSRDPYLYLIFIPSQQREWWSCQLKPSVNLPETQETKTATSACGEWEWTCLMGSTLSSYMLVILTMNSIYMRV